MHDAASYAAVRASAIVAPSAVTLRIRPPFVTSGLRIGTPAATTRGFREGEVIELAGWIADVLDANGSDDAVAKVRTKVAAICSKFPVYGK